MLPLISFSPQDNFSFTTSQVVIILTISPILKYLKFWIIHS